MKMGYKQINLKNYRAYLDDLKERLDLKDTQEEYIYQFIDDSYNLYELDEYALFKTFQKIETHTSLSIKEKIFAGMLLILCDLKTQNVRKETESKARFLKSIPEEEEEEEDEENE